MFEFKDPIDVIMSMVFVAAGLAVVFAAYDVLSENIRFNRPKKSRPGTTPACRPFKPGHMKTRIKKQK